MKALITSLALMASASAAAAQPAVMRVGKPESPISSAVVVPPGAQIVFVSGIPGQGADTRAQTMDSITKISETLKAQGMSLSDVVMMHVYLVGTPATGGHMDFAGMMTAFKTFFGTAAQPNKPSRTTVQVAALGTPETLVEIDAEAVRTH
jgi:2-iminobutanoate/2-iminopropanoate deaminase